MAYRKCKECGSVMAEWEETCQVCGRKNPVDYTDAENKKRSKPIRYLLATLFPYKSEASEKEKESEC